MQLIDDGVTLTKTPAKKPLEIPVPETLYKALMKNRKAIVAFEKLPPSHRKEYIMWINEAKTDATREKRITTAIEWVSQGKNWKYERQQ